MEQNMPTMTKKIWNIMRVAFYMLRKGICKRKILMDLNMMMKRGKIAGKALHNIMFHLNHHHHNNNQHHRGGANPMVAGDEFSMHMQQFSTSPQGEYEFSCSNTPLYKQYFTNNKRKNHKSFYYMPSPFEENNNIDIYDMMGLSSNEFEASSPALPGLGFGRSPAVRQLRVTDSPFPVQNNEAEDAKHVDAAAEDFINKFYSQLKQQKYY